MMKKVSPQSNLQHPQPKIQSQMVMAQAKKNNFEETEVEDNVGSLFEQTTSGLGKIEPLTLINANKEEIEFMDYLHLGARKWSQREILTGRIIDRQAPLTNTSNPSLSASARVGKMIQDCKIDNNTTTPSGLSNICCPQKQNFSGEGQIEDNQQFEQLYQ